VPNVAVVLGASASAGPSQIAAAAKVLGVEPTFYVPAEASRSEELLKVASLFGAAYKLPAKNVSSSIREAGVQGVVTFDDSLLELVDEATGDEFLANPWDKLVQRTCFTAVGASKVQALPVTSQRSVELALADMPEILLLKPRRSNTGRGIKFVDRSWSSEQIWSWIAGQPATFGGYILESAFTDVSSGLNGLAPFISVESSVVGREIRHFAVFDKLPQSQKIVETGDISSCSLDPDLYAEALTCAEAAIRSLQLNNRVVHTEVRLTTDGPQVVEVNGRLGGYVADLAKDVGATDPVEIAIASSLGRLIEIRKPGTQITSCAVQVPLYRSSESQRGDLKRLLRQQTVAYGLAEPDPVHSNLHYVSFRLRGFSRAETLRSLRTTLQVIATEFASVEVLDLQWLEAVVSMTETSR
jgi:hypothetical protein